MTIKQKQPLKNKSWKDICMYNNNNNKQNRYYD